MYSEGFREGQLWQAILSRMRSPPIQILKQLLHTLKGLELNSRYALERFINQPEFITADNKRELLIEMKPARPLYLNKNDDCYQYELIVLLFTSKGAFVHHEMQQTKWMDINERTSKKIFNFQKPAPAKYYLLCLHLRSGINGVATDTFTSRGMAIVQALQMK